MFNHIISYYLFPDYPLLYYTLASGIAALGGCVCVNFGLALKNPTLHVLGSGISELRCTGHVEYLAAGYITAVKTLIKSS